MLFLPCFLSRQTCNHWTDTLFLFLSSHLSPPFRCPFFSTSFHATHFLPLCFRCFSSYFPFLCASLLSIPDFLYFNFCSSSTNTRFPGFSPFPSRPLFVFLSALHSRPASASRVRPATATAASSSRKALPSNVLTLTGTAVPHHSAQGSLHRRRKAQSQARLRIRYLGHRALAHAPSAHDSDAELASVELEVTQQLARGGAVRVFRGRVRVGEIFEVSSRRRGDDPLGLTLTLNRYVPCPERLKEIQRGREAAPLRDNRKTTSNIVWQAIRYVLIIVTKLDMSLLYHLSYIVNVCR